MSKSGGFLLGAFIGASAAAVTAGASLYPTP